MMRRWTLYPFVLISAAALVAIAVILASRSPTPVLSASDVEPLIARLYRLLRTAEPGFYVLFSVLLTPFVIGAWRSADPVSEVTLHDQQVLLSTVVHVVLLTIGGAVIYLWRPFGSILEDEDILRVIDRSTATLEGVTPNTWITLSVLVLVPTLLLLLWRNPEGLHTSRDDMLLPAMLLLDSLALLILAYVPQDTWLWAGMAGLFLPTSVLWMVIWSRGLRQAEDDNQIGAFIFLVLVTLPLAAGTAYLLRTWMQRPETVPQTLADVRLASLAPYVPSLTALLAWSAIGCGVFVLILVGLICRRTTELLAIAERMRLSRRELSLPRRTYPTVVVDPPQIGFRLIDLPLAVLFALAERLADVTLRTASLIDRLVTAGVEWIIRSVYFVAVTLINLVITLVVHLIYTLARLPGLLLAALRYILDAFDTVIRFLVFPVGGYLFAAVGLAIALHAAVGYFLGDTLSLLAWTIWGIGVVLFGIVTCLAAVSKISPGDTTYWYLLGLVEYLPYPMVVLCVLLWVLIFAAPKFGIHHFQPGIVTWTLTVLIALVLAYGLLFGERKDLVRN